MSMMERILRLMAEKKASDVYLSANSPALIKIDGECVPINSQLSPPMLRALCWPRWSRRTIWKPSKKRASSTSASPARRGPFSHQRHAPARLGGRGRSLYFAARAQPGIAAAASRFWTNLIFQKRGLILVVGSTGSGKSTTLAAMIDSRNESMSGHILTIEDPIEFQFRNKKSIVNQREVGTDTQSHANCPEKRAAPSARRDFDWRNPRPRNHVGSHRLRTIGPPVPGHAARQQQLPRLEPHLELLPRRGAPHPAGRFVLVAQSGHHPAPGAHRRWRAHCRRPRCCSTPSWCPN